MQPERTNAPALGMLGRAGGVDQGLVVLMAARLALSVVSLGIALAVDTTVGGVDEPGSRGLYGTVALAFLATALTGVLLPRMRRPARFAALNLAADIGIVSSLVHHSGGPDSHFAFLYVVVALYGTLLLERRGALIAAGLGTAAYAGVLLVAFFGSMSGPVAAAPMVLLATWAIHAGAMATVAVLASTLAGELRQRTRALEQLSSLHERTVASLMSGLLTTDSKRRITSFNPEAESITGTPAAEAIGQLVDTILPGLDDRSAEAGSGRLRMGFRDQEGNDRFLGVGTYALRTGDAGPDGLVVIFQDVTDVVAMEQELRRSERLAAVGELSASIAHEIRNPLAAISGSIQMLKREADGRVPGGQDARLMGIVLRETERLNRLIGDFLHYARPGPRRVEAIQLAELVVDMREMLDAALGSDMELEVSIPTELAVQADAGQLRQVLWNLVLNSMQAMPTGGRIQIDAREIAVRASQAGVVGGRNEEEKEACVEICVRDSGVGIAAEVLEHIFDPFFTTKSEGSGLGLATVHRIVEEHGGSLNLESAEGMGTTACVRLPQGESE
jgi:two-component system sensor histidine kinase PilS (NtrC family)